MVKAEITITKTFDESRSFSKTWEVHDFEQFLKEEGEYLDRLAKTLEEKGKANEGFTVTYTVTASKG